MSSSSPVPNVTIGRMVTYRSKTGRYSLPAVVAATPKTLFEPAVAAGFVPELTAADHVHLVVFTAGLAGNRLPDTDPAIKAEAFGGTYQEHDIPFWGSPTDSWDQELQPAGTWTWPSRA